MESSIQTITDKTKFESIFQHHFAHKQIFLKTQNGNIIINYLGFVEGQVSFKIPLLKNMPPSCLIFVREPGQTIYAGLRHIEKQGEDDYVFEVMKIQVIAIARKEERKAVQETDSGKTILFVSNIISDSTIQNSLALNERKVARIKNHVISQLERIFRQYKVFFINERSNDSRMKYFYDNGGYFFIPDLQKTPSSEYIDTFTFYMDHIYNKDYSLLNRRNLISEIAVPIMFKGILPYGYIQVNHDAVLTEKLLEIVKRLSVIVDELLFKNQVLSLSGDKLLVSDISEHGLGIVFRERKYIRFFQENKYVYFQLFLPAKGAIEMLLLVRNITIMENKIIKVGCEIVSMDEQDNERYLSYMNI